jgi:hypothetical protein
MSVWALVDTLNILAAATGALKEGLLGDASFEGPTELEQWEILADEDNGGDEALMAQFAEQVQSILRGNQ